MHKHLDRYRAQVWNGQKLVTDIGGTEEIPGLSYDAAKEIAFTLPNASGWSGRIMSLDRDYCEVLSPDMAEPKNYRCGTFAETTIVLVPRD